MDSFVHVAITNQTQSKGGGGERKVLRGIRTCAMYCWSGLFLPPKSNSAA